MIAMGKGPHIIIRGKPFEHREKIPVHRAVDGRSAAEVERDYAKVRKLQERAHAEIKESRRHARKSDGAIRHVGSTPLHKFLAARKQLGEEAFRGKELRKTLRDIGSFFPGER